MGLLVTAIFLTVILITVILITVILVTVAVVTVAVVTVALVVMIGRSIGSRARSGWLRIGCAVYKRVAGWGVLVVAVPLAHLVRHLADRVVRVIAIAAVAGTLLSFSDAAAGGIEGRPQPQRRRRGQTSTAAQVYSHELLL